MGLLARMLFRKAQGGGEPLVHSAGQRLEPSPSCSIDSANHSHTKQSVSTRHKQVQMCLTFRRFCEKGAATSLLGTLLTCHNTNIPVTRRGRGGMFETLKDAAVKEAKDNDNRAAPSMLETAGASPQPLRRSHFTTTASPIASLTLREQN